MEAPGSIFAPFMWWPLEVVIFYPKNLVALGGHLAKESVSYMREFGCVSTGMLRLISCIWVHSLADVSGPLRAAFAVLGSLASLKGIFTFVLFLA